MQHPLQAKCALTLPPIPWQVDASMAVRTQDTETLGRRIARLRREKGLTQAELAERLQVSQPVVSDYENDVIRLPADVVVQIAQILDASTDELLGVKPPIPRSGTGIKNRRLYRRMQEIEKLPRRDQDALLRTIEAFISKSA
jgi:transcriptional regulator with XRE-family HTH domain